MNFAAEIVIRKNNDGYEAGFASRTSGTKVESFGKWYGSQMSYRPFLAAMAAAEDRADELNAELVRNRTLSPIGCNHAADEKQKQN